MLANPIQISSDFEYRVQLGGGGRGGGGGGGGGCPPRASIVLSPPPALPSKPYQKSVFFDFRFIRRRFRDVCVAIHHHFQRVVKFETAEIPPLLNEKKY